MTHADMDACVYTRITTSAVVRCWRRIGASLAPRAHEFATPCENPVDGGATHHRRTTPSQAGDPPPPGRRGAYRLGTGDRRLVGRAARHRSVHGVPVVGGADAIALDRARDRGSPARRSLARAPSTACAAPCGSYTPPMVDASRTRPARSTSPARSGSNSRSGWRPSGIEEPDAWLAAARDETLSALHRLGPTNARALGKAVPTLTTKILTGAGKYMVEQSLHTRLLQNLGFDGTIVRTNPAGGWTSSEFTWCLTTDWLPAGIAGADPDASRDELVGRYVHAFGPVTTADVQWWTGLTMAGVKAAIAAIDAVEVTLESAPRPGCCPTTSSPSTSPTRGWRCSRRSTPPRWGGRAASGTSASSPRSAVRCSTATATSARRCGATAEWSAAGRSGDGEIVFELLIPVDAGTSEGHRRGRRPSTGAASMAPRCTPRFPTPLQRVAHAGLIFARRAGGALPRA